MIYTARTHTTGGREDGVSRRSDGRLDVKLSLPSSARVGTNKRVPGSGCAALEGINRIHAILGTSPSCIAVHPSDVAVAMTALDAKVETLSPTGTARTIPLNEFRRLPGMEPQVETAARRRAKDLIPWNGSLYSRQKVPVWPIFWT
jgi:CO/xanthine dehydrogenase FAD-binding subunit